MKKSAKKTFKAARDLEDHIDKDITAVGDGALIVSRKHLVKAHLDAILACADMFPDNSMARARLIHRHVSESVRLQRPRLRKVQP